VLDDRRSRAFRAQEMSMSTLHAVPADFAAHARVKAADYEKLYAEYGVKS